MLRFLHSKHRARQDETNSFRCKSLAEWSRFFLGFHRMTNQIYSHMLLVYLCWMQRNMDDVSITQLSIDLWDRMPAFYRANQQRVYRGCCRSRRNSQAVYSRISKYTLADAHQLCKTTYQNQAYQLSPLSCLTNSTAMCLKFYRINALFWVLTFVFWLLPLKIVFLPIISAKIHPADHMSIGLE